MNGESLSYDRKTHSLTVYVIIALAFFLICTWQYLEHHRVKDSAHTALLTRAIDISNTVGVVIRSQARFFGIVNQQRLEDALQELTKSEELRSVLLLNAEGKETASAGDKVDYDLNILAKNNEQWHPDTRVVTFANLVDLGSALQQDENAPGATPPIIITEGEERFRRLSQLNAGDVLDEATVKTLNSFLDERASGQEGAAALRVLKQGDTLTDAQSALLRSVMRAAMPEPFRRGPGRPDGPRPEGERPEGTGPGGPPPDFERGRREPPNFTRPPGMSEDAYADLVKKQGVHQFMVSLSTKAFEEEIARDLWLRFSTVFISFAAALVLGFAWRTHERSSLLQTRLLRARELNIHLQEMNVAAAGLAHETRNPLNIISGLAQLISKNPQAHDEVKAKSREITEEVDRVTGRLNQFIEYSRPPDVRPAPTNLKAVVQDVASALDSDIEDKEIQFNVSGPDLTIQADESSLRQVLFNLILNAIQAVGRSGRIEVALMRIGKDEAAFEVRDNGPGVPENARELIFQPYYTTSKRGTGLGLAVVRQIVLAHQWEVKYLPGEEAGSRFSITGIKVS